ncbi:BTB domain-containing protein [Favolaschia claudopus]|uniref:BTB domain-containing protein n=1 Tax=Favolaschia claudopus TaxID=2862362 RepID=A0AAW0DK05_9AGAR
MASNSYLVWQPFPYIPFALFLVSFISGLTLTTTNRGHYIRPSLFFLPILWLTYCIIRDAEAGYISSSLWITFFGRASELLLLTTSGSGFRESVNTGEDDKNMSLGARIERACHLIFNLRGIGQENEPSSLRAHRLHDSINIIHSKPHTTESGTTRPAKCTNSRRFILLQLARVAVSLLLLDFVNLHLRLWNPGFYQRLGLVAVGWRWRIAGTLTFAVGAASALECGHSIIGVICFVVGVWGKRKKDIEEWPLLFDVRVENVMSLRAFWGRGWHHLIRLPISAHTKFVSQTVFRLPTDRSFLSSSIYFLLVFTFSGLLHYVSESMCLGFGFGPRRSGSLLFFPLQAVGIAIEHVATNLISIVLQPQPQPQPKSTSTSSMRRRWHRLVANVLGAAWVFGWFVLTLPIWVDPLLKTGVMESRGEWSFIMWVVNGTAALPPSGGMETN